MNNIRIEKKFVFGKYKEDYIQKILICNGFKNFFTPREVNSIYLDTLNFNFAKDNINGSNFRKKIRFRWYNNDFTNIYFEEKLKQNFFVKKIVKKLNKNKNNIYFLNNISLTNFNIHQNYRLVLKTNYLRSYWISQDKKIRATIDTNLTASPMSNLNRKLNLNNTILEFKFLPSHEKNFRDLFFLKNLNIRNNKYSKYLQSFLLLDDSGLINFFSPH